MYTCIVSISMIVSMFIIIIIIRSASVAACLTILSYTATGVVSSVSAADYLKCSPMFSGIQGEPPVSHWSNAGVLQK